MLKEINDIRDVRGQLEATNIDSLANRATRDVIVKNANGQIRDKTENLQALLGSVLLDYPDDAEANYALGEVYRSQGLNEISRVFYRRALLNTPEDQLNAIKYIGPGGNGEPLYLTGGELYYRGVADVRELPNDQVLSKINIELGRERSGAALFDPDNDGATYVLGNQITKKTYISEFISRAMSMSKRFSDYVYNKNVLGSKPKVGT